MLLKFDVSNLLSFDNRVSLSMIPSLSSKKDTIKLKNSNVLQFSAIYGANASGKSNVVHALDIMQRIIKHGVNILDINSYCKNDASNKNKPTEFEILYYINGRYYNYGFSLIISKGVLENEWLEIIDPKNDSKKTILNYARGNRNVDTVFYDNTFQNETKDRLKTYLYDLSDNKEDLLMSDLVRKKIKSKDLVFVKDFKEWINLLDINFPEEPIDFYEYMADENFDRVENILNEFNTGISKVYFEKVTVDEIIKKTDKEVVEGIIKDIESHIKKQGKVMGIIRGGKELYRIKADSIDNIEVSTIKLKHNNCSTAFDFREESDGTRRLFDLLDIVLTGKQHAIYVIDELEKSLHPVLVKRLLEILRVEFTKRKIQLIFTTHETHIMDLKLFRKDEIWFVEKNEYGASNLFSLDIFKVRSDKIIENGYLNGIYGGIPLFKKMVD